MRNEHNYTCIVSAEVTLHPEAEHVFIIASKLEGMRTAITNVTVSKVPCSNVTGKSEICSILIEKLSIVTQKSRV